MTIEAVLFDYSGTLFRFEEDESWSDVFVGTDGRAFDVHEKAEILRRMTAPVEQLMEFDAELQYAWDNRDLDPALHRIVMLKVLLRSGVPTEQQAAQLYDKLLDPLAWTPYPDTGTALSLLAAQDIPVAVVSNIPFDVRPAFAKHGWSDAIHTYTLSFEVGAVKPDPRIFRSALDKLGATAETTLMIGDSAEADGAATTLGCQFELVEALPTTARPDALTAALRRHGMTS